jgi:hypothetical protein
MMPVADNTALTHVSGGAVGGPQWGGNEGQTPVAPAIRPPARDGSRRRLTTSTCRIHLPHGLLSKETAPETACLSEPTPGLEPGTPSLRVMGGRGNPGMRDLSRARFPAEREIALTGSSLR